MEIYFLGADLQNVSPPIDNYLSLACTRRYYDAGAFEAHLSPAHYRYLSQAKFTNMGKTTGIIRSVEYNSESAGLTVKGSLAEDLLLLRYVDTDETVFGNLESEIRRIVTKYALTGTRAIPNLTLGDIAGLSDTIDAQIPAGTNLGSWLRETLKTYSAGYRVVHTYPADQFVFSVYRGVDRTQEQDDNGRAIFSTGFDNLTGVTVVSDDTDYKNYFYVVGAEIDGVRAVVELDLRAAGAERREYYLDAREVSATDSETGDPIPVERYLTMLEQYGRETAATFARVESIAAKILPTPGMLYRTHYDIGDLCDIEVRELGKVWSDRLTGMREVYEGGGIKYEPEFGETRKSIRQLINREGKRRGA